MARRGRFGWVWKSLLGLVVAGALLVADAALKAGPQPAFCPPDPLWTVAAFDFPRVMGRIEGLDAYRAYAEAARPPLNEWERRTRLAVGIRPQPVRWQVWLGPRVLFAGTGESYGLCARPGLALRTAAAIHALFARSSDQGIREWRGWAYALRDGCLIASPSTGYVAAALEAEPADVDFPEGDAVAVTLGRDRRLACTLHIRDGLPVEGRLAVALAGADGPLPTPFDADAPYPAAIHAHNWPDLAELASLLPESLGEWAAPLCQGALPNTAGRAWHAPASETWSRGGSPCGVALAGVRADGAMVWPELVWTAAGEPPALDRLGETVVPYAWDDWQGGLAPVVGPDFTWAVAAREMRWVAASNAETMQAALPSVVEGPSDADADALVRIDWREFARAASTVRDAAASAGYITAAGAHRMFSLEGLEALGRAEVRLAAEGAATAIDGRLFALESD